jgi:hypothetical protein
VKATAGLLETLSLTGLVPGPPQQCGAVRLLPLLRAQVREDLRLSLRRYGEPLGVVALDGEPDGLRADRGLGPGLKYIGYVPHGLVVSYSDDGSPVAALGAQLHPSTEAQGPAPARCVRLLHRMVKRQGERSLRLLPLHLSMEGLLSLQFGGPDIAWSEYSRQALRYGLDPRSESAIPGRGVAHLEEALRIFEIHDSQCGVMICVGDALASIFVVPHPSDYRALHRSLVEDFYGELIAHYSQQIRGLPSLARSAASLPVPRSLSELRRWLSDERMHWAEVGQVLAGGLLGRRLRAERLYRMGPFVLQRFVTSLQLSDENHIGEAIVREDGTVEYMKSFRLSDKQAKRAYLLQVLAAHHWNLDAAASSQGQTREQWVDRLRNAGFEYLLSDAVLRAARKRS